MTERTRREPLREFNTCLYYGSRYEGRYRNPEPTLSDVRHGIAVTRFNDPRVTRTTFAEDLLEQVFLRTRTGDFKAGQVDGEYQVWLGNRLYAAADPHDAWSAALRDLVDAKPLSPSEREAVDEAAAAAEAEEQAQSDTLIDTLTEDGMSPVGEAVTALRAERDRALDNAYDRMMEESLKYGQQLPRYPEDWISELTQRTDLDEIDISEVKHLLERKNRARAQGGSQSPDDANPGADQL